ncbi:helix-turn-helix domain-containing protein [Nocardia asiatica]|uniref:helix-turn-helix domain-containing protein n=1 Tax=Nocardia asiatica TaxID=209252 RepID=UPI003CC7C4B8
MSNRAELAAFLRTRRGRLRPSDGGLPELGARRTPGPRRQEVAQLAGISVDYYIRVEQARGSRPSRQVLSALTRALVLSIDRHRSAHDRVLRDTGITDRSHLRNSRTDGRLNAEQTAGTGVRDN